MAGQCGIVASSACLLLLVLLPRALAEGSCTYGYLPYQFTSPGWPECLTEQLANQLSGTFYIKVEGSAELEVREGGGGGGGGGEI